MRLPNPPRSLSRWLGPTGVAAITTLAFLPSLGGDFLTWDDHYKLRDNVRYRGLGATQLQWMWTTTHTGLYQPMAWMTWGADYLLWGANPIGYHLTSVLCHAAAAALVYVLARRLFALAQLPPAGARAGASHAGAALAALFFGVHPLRVEPVAWISARGDVLAGLFTVGAVLAYLRACPPGTEAGTRRSWLAASVGLFGLGLLSKPAAVALPAVLVVLDVYPLRRLGGGPGGWLGPPARRVSMEKLPFVAAALAVALLAVVGKSRTASMLPSEPVDAAGAVARALFAAVFYLWKTVMPGQISPLYERPATLDPFTWPFVTSGLAVLVITLGLVAGRRRWPAGLAAWVGYLVLLVPSSGLVAYGSQLVAARYSYVSCLGWAILVGATLPVLDRAHREGRLRPAFALGAASLAGVLVLGLGTLSWRLTQVWRDSETLWRYTLSVTPRSALAHLELGLLAERQGDLMGAEAHFSRALAIWPGAHLADVAIAAMFEREGNYAAAAAHYRRALARGAESRVLSLALGRALANAGRLVEARAELEAAIVRFPDFADAHVMLAIVLAAQGREDAAITELRTALRLAPDSALGHYHLAAALARTGQRGEAAEHLRRALALDPRLADAGRALDATLRGGPAASGGTVP